MPNSFLTDLILRLDWRYVGGAAGAGLLAGGVQTLAPEAAKAALLKAEHLIDIALEFFEASGPANCMIAGCAMITLYQLSMCLELKALHKATSNTEVAAALGIDLPQLQTKVDSLVSWWGSRRSAIDIENLEEFIIQSDSLAVQIQRAQITLIQQRDKLEVNKKKSELIQVVTGIATMGFGSVALRAGTFLGKAGLGAGVSAIGFATSTWYIWHVDDCANKLSLLNDEIKVLAAKVKAPVTVLEMRLSNLGGA